MRCSVTCDGVPIGVVWLHGGPTAAGWLVPLRAFSQFGLRAPARRLGVAIAIARWSRLKPLVKSRALARAMDEADALAPRLGLLDPRGTTLPAVSIVLVAFARRAPVQSGTYVVVRLDEHPATVPATVAVPPGSASGVVHPAREADDPLRRAS